MTYFECDVKILNESVYPFQSYDTLYWAGVCVTWDKPANYCENGWYFQRLKKYRKNHISAWRHLVWGFRDARECLGIGLHLVHLVHVMHSLCGIVGRKEHLLNLIAVLIRLLPCVWLNLSNTKKSFVHLVIRFFFQYVKGPSDWKGVTIQYALCNDNNNHNHYNKRNNIWTSTDIWQHTKNIQFVVFRLSMAHFSKKRHSSSW